MRLVVVKISEVVQLVRRSFRSSSYKFVQLMVVKISKAVQLGTEILVRCSQSCSQISELRVRAISRSNDL